MSKNIFHLKESDMSGHEEILLLSGNNPMTFLYIGFRSGEGFSGGLFVNPARAPLDVCAGEIDRAIAAGDAIPFRPIMDEIPASLLSTAVLTPDEGTETGYAQEGVRTFAGMISDRMPTGAIDFLRRPVLRRDAPMIDQVNYLSCGDREARIQALRSVPMHTGPLLSDPSFRDLVDRRAPLSPLIAERGRLEPAEMRRYAQIETRLASILARALNGEEPLVRDPLAQPGGFSSQILRLDTDNLRPIAVQAARLLRADQIPQTPEETVDMLTYISEANRLRSVLNLGEGPFRRHLRRVPPARAMDGVWGAACAHLQAQLPQTETADYLRSLSTAMITGLLISRIRTRPEVDFEVFGRAAHLLREKGEPDRAEAAALGAYVQELSAGDYRLNQVRTEMIRLIGEGHTLKSLREAQVRWHHVRQTFENDVMTSRDPLAWSPLIGAIDLDGVSAVELTSSAALDRQGHLEKHCVGGYTGTVMGATSERASLIFSLERGERILSTIELVVKKSPWDKKNITWEISQNKAARNATPDPEAIVAGESLRDALSGLPKRRVRDYLSGIQSNTTQLRDTLALVTTRYGGDVVNRDLPERVMSAYAEVIPKTLQGLGPEAVLGELSLLTGEDMTARFDAVTDRIIKALPEAEVHPADPEETGLQMAS
jgi:hypothetical protein